MTYAQFAALAKLLRARNGAATRAACLVLVYGVVPGQAARATGLSPASVSNAVTRFKKGMALAQASITD